MQILDQQKCCLVTKQMLIQVEFLSSELKSSLLSNEEMQTENWGDNTLTTL